MRRRADDPTKVIHIRQMRITDAVFGIRRDVDLNQHWWHRLAKVAFVLVSAFLAFKLAAVTGEPNPSQLLVDVTIKDDLKAFIESHAESAEPISDFFARPGLTGARSEEVVLGTHPSMYARTYCSRDWSRVDPSLVQRMTDDTEGLPESRDRIFNVTAIFRGLSGAHCVSLDDLTFKAGDLVKYELSAGVYTAHYLTVAEWFLLIGGGWLLLSLNAYYRGLVYVVCGPRRQNS
jgi:hypothetical protein